MHNRETNNLFFIFFNLAQFLIIIIIGRTKRNAAVRICFSCQRERITRRSKDMKITRKLIKLCSVFVLFTVFLISAAQSQPRQNNGDVLVGRISYIEGQLLRYVPEDKDWVAAVIDAPFGMEDSLYTAENSGQNFSSLTIPGYALMIKHRFRC